MKTKNGEKYGHNYDFIVKWMAETLKGQTLDVIGIKTGRIVEVFGFEPVDIAVKAGRVDVVFKDDAKNVFHIEEERDLEKADLYRYASQHFQGAKQWPKLKDIILASGKPYTGPREIKTGSGTYAPIIIDFTQKDGRRRLKEIREAVSKGNFDNWLELVFLPLYGKETGKERSEIAEEVIRFESELYREKKIPVKLIAATLIMSNKMIDKDRIKEIWEEIKMLDFFEIAREEGKLETAREMLMNALVERFKMDSFRFSEQINALKNPDIIKALFNQALRCQNLKEFDIELGKVS